MRVTGLVEGKVCIVTGAEICVDGGFTAQ